MSVEAQELADNLRATARAMRESAKRLGAYGTTATKAKSDEMEGAAAIAEEWADAIEAEYCKADSTTTTTTNNQEG
jgi:hypothetical protein